MCAVSVHSLYRRATDTPGTFASIIHDTFLTHGIITRLLKTRKAWRKRRRDRFLDSYMTVVLLRITSKIWESNYLLTYLDATIEFLSSFVYYTSQTKNYRSELCNAMATALSTRDTLAYLKQGPYDDSVKVRANMGRSDTIGMLAAAATVGSEAAVLFLIDKVRSVSTCSELLGTPLLAACANGKIMIARILFDRMVQTEEGALSQVWYIVESLMETRRNAMLSTLLDWYFSLRPDNMRGRRRKQRNCLNWALINGDLKVFQLCLDRCTGGPCSCGLDRPVFRTACEYGHADIVKYLIDNAALEACQHHMGFTHLTEGLWTAVQHNWLVAAKVLLDHGADANGMYDNYGTRVGSALYWAVRDGYEDMIVLLLAYGAIVRGREAAGSPNIMRQAQEQGGVVEKLIRQAMLKQLRRAL